jgi:hypothetical protein
MNNDNGVVNLSKFTLDFKLGGGQSWYGHWTGEEITVHDRDRILTHALFSPYPSHPIR